MSDWTWEYIPDSAHVVGGFTVGWPVGEPRRDKKVAAAAARQALLDGPADQAAAGAWTVARWLRCWLTRAEPHLRPSALHSYRSHIDRYLPARD